MTGYPDTLDTRALTTWPGTLTRDEQRVRSPYSATLTTTLDELERELRAVRAVHPVLEVAIDPAQWRTDGRPYARAQAQHPGVVLSLPTTEAGALRFACDRFTTWQANLRAIVLTMGALRAVERHGAVQAREQYAGFAALPPGASAATPMAATKAMTVDEAAQVLAEHGSQPDREFDPTVLISDPAYRGIAYRRAARQLHPDAGGDRATWDRLEQAKRLLDEQGGLS